MPNGPVGGVHDGGAYTASYPIFSSPCLSLLERTVNFLRPFDIKASPKKGPDFIKLKKILALQTRYNTASKRSLSKGISLFRLNSSAIPSLTLERD
ncbi:MAG: hypothetical protein LBV23_08850 [Deltaproteobacteria bacterium]|nr:hypothetical protein [Deltaproteobacteria bacterium]